MAPSPRASSFFALLVVLFALSVAVAPVPAVGAGVFRVRRTFPRHGGVGEVEEHLAALRRHDGRRHGRLLGAVDLPLGGDGLPTGTGLYFTRIEIGAPPKGYYVQVDTGSDILWVNCIRCDGCPTSSSLGVLLQAYPSSSSLPFQVCDFFSRCFSIARIWGGLLADRADAVRPGGEREHGGVRPGVLRRQQPRRAAHHVLVRVAVRPCQFRITYGEGSSATGFYVTDSLRYDQVSGNGQTTPSNATITFGCGARLGGDLGSSNLALDGILGFGQSNSSMLSQLAAAGKVQKIFAHCLDSVNGGGIFAIGNVVQPKVKTTPLVPDMPHYNVNLKGVAVGGAILQLPTNTFDSGENKGTIIDSATTLAYLPDAVYRTLIDAVFNKHQDMASHNYQDFLCFWFSGSVDDGFPIITFSFEGDLTLNVYPHDYLFQNGNDFYCVGFLNGGLQTKDGKDMVLLGDLILSNKLVVYDLENQVIGWTDYNCSSSIKIKDDMTGFTYTVDAHNISSGWRFQWHKSLILLLVTTIWSYLMF